VTLAPPLALNQRLNRPTMSETTPQRSVYFISDGTGITAETFGHSVLSQFEGIRFTQQRMPFIDTVDKAEQVVSRINQRAIQEGVKPIIFSTLVNVPINSAVKKANAVFMDLFATFVEPLEHELGVKSNHTIGKGHSAADSERYKKRIEAINFTLAHDDGQSAAELALADIILVGVSRSGKTPTSLYLAMQHGIKAANCPLIPEDFERRTLPKSLYGYKHKLFGLTITPDRLHEIRHERRPNSRYASIENCRHEVSEAESLMRREGIKWLSSTTKSIEEIAATILENLGNAPSY
jgi:[pyruvate, water dikinase]-phosphate phosphotransferase / [pyruvate, water dikinase] kinase